MIPSIPFEDGTFAALYAEDAVPVGREILAALRAAFAELAGWFRGARW